MLLLLHPEILTPQQDQDFEWASASYVDLGVKYGYLVAMWASLACSGLGSGLKNLCVAEVSKVTKMQYQ